MTTEESAQTVCLMWGGFSSTDEEPVKAVGLEGQNVKQVACAVGRKCHDSEDEVEKFHRSYILTEEGKVYQWGPSSNWKSVRHKRRQITSGSLVETPVVQIAAGYTHFAAVTNEGDLYTWGNGELGATGHGNNQDLDHPQKVEGLNGICIVQVACLIKNTVALSKDGKVYTFGSNEGGCNGNGRKEGKRLLPVQVEEIPPIKSIAAVALHVAAVCHQGCVYTWGCGRYGRLGLGDEMDCSTPKKVEALSQEQIVQVSCGPWHTAALSSSGKVYSFGDGCCGKLGYDEEQVAAPKLVESFKETRISQVSCGQHRTCFLSDMGELYKCGGGEHESDGNVLVPCKVQSLRIYNIKQVHAFDIYTFVWATRRPLAPDARPIVVSLRNMVNNEENADVTFQIGNEKVFAHKVFLVERSQFFRTMFGSGMRESSNQVIPLSGIRKNVLLLVLEYLYTGIVAGTVPEELVVDLYMAAEMYGLDSLKPICEKSFGHCLTAANAAQLLVMTDGVGVQGLADICFKFVVENFKAVSKTPGMAQVADNAALSLKIMRAVAVHN